MPDFDASILTSRDDDGEVWVKRGKGDVLCMSFQCLNTGLVLIVPNFNKARKK